MNSDLLKQTLKTIAIKCKVRISKVTLNQARKHASDVFLKLGVNLDNLTTEDFNVLRDSEVIPDIVAQDIKTEALRPAVKKNKAAENNLVFTGVLDSAADIAFKNGRFPVIQVPAFVPKTSKVIDREANLILSDLHIGSCIPSRVGLTEFGHVQEARRLSKVIDQFLNYKMEHRDSTKAIIHVLGDLIPNIIHEGDGAILVDQCCAVIHLLTQAFGLVASAFNEVEIHVLPGNHDRWGHKKDRGTFNKWDSLGNLIYYGIKNGLKNLKNVKFNMYYSPYYVRRSFDQSGFFTHGDTVLNPGRPNNKIDTNFLEKQVLRFQAGIGENDLFAVGHVHIASATKLPSGPWMVTNGTIMPNDQYGQSLGFMSSSCGQWIFESSPGHIWGDSRFVSVGTEDDKNATLDSIIKPYVSMVA
jgi:hypothetical protein